MNHLNCANSNQFIPANLTKINDSADVRTLNKILSWYGESTDAAASTVSTRTPSAYVPSLHKAHTPSLVHSVYSYPLVTTPHTFFIHFTARDPPSPWNESPEESVTPKGNPMTRNNPPNP